MEWLTWDLDLLLSQQNMASVQSRDVFWQLCMIPSLIRAAGTTTNKECPFQDGDAAFIFYPGRYLDEQYGHDLQRLHLKMSEDAVND